MADHPSALSTDENTLLQAALETPFSTSSSDTIPPQTTSSVPHSALSPSQLDPEPHTHHDESTETLQFDQQSSIETLTEIHDDGSVLMEQTSSDEQPEVGWESVGEKAGATASKGTSSDTSLWPTPAESTEAESQVKSQTPTPTFPYSTPETDSQRWEDVPSSMASSFPSMSFPERTTSPSPEPTKPTPDPPAISATTAIFDPSLSKRVRLSAFLSSLAINLLLPFVNGVMLGFGEIFAKNVIVNWFGWKQTTIKRKGISDVGIGAPLPSEQRKRSSR